MGAPTEPTRLKKSGNRGPRALGSQRAATGPIHAFSHPEARFQGRKKEDIARNDRRPRGDFRKNWGPTGGGGWWGPGKKKRITVWPHPPFFFYFFEDRTEGARDCGGAEQTPIRPAARNPRQKQEALMIAKLPPPCGGGGGDLSRAAPIP